MDMHTTVRVRSNGFTLIELLVSLTILSVLMTLLFSGFRFTQKVEQRIDDGLLKVSDVAMAQAFIRKSIEQTEAISYRNERGEIVHAFYGDEKEVRFIAPLGRSGSKAGLHRVSLRFVDDNGVNKLIADIRRYQLWSDWESDDDQDSVVLIEGFDGEGFEYSDANPGGLMWRSTWRDQEKLPSAIRVKLYYADKGVVMWPNLVASTHVGNYKTRKVAR